MAPEHAGSEDAGPPLPSRTSHAVGGVTNQAVECTTHNTSIPGEICLWHTKSWQYLYQARVVYWRNSFL